MRTRPQHQPADTAKCEFAAALRAMGLSWSATAAEMGVSPRRCQQLVCHHQRIERMEAYFQKGKPWT